MTRILAACSPGEVRVAVVTSGQLQEFAIWRPGRPDGVGDTYRGRILVHLPALAGAFVSLPGLGEGFLPDSEGGALTGGAACTVRITRAAQGGKGPRLTAKIEQSNGAPGLVARGPGAVERLATTFPDAEVIIDDLAVATSLRPSLEHRISTARIVLDDALSAEIETLSELDVTLPGGMRASIHPTPALVAIDVDTAAASADQRQKPAAQLAANQAAIPELARQIRLRNLSGAIVIDLAGLNLRRRAALGTSIESALAADPLRPRFLGFSGLGLAEILRPRVHPPLHEILTSPHAAGLSALRSIMTDSKHVPHAAFTLHAAPAVVCALQDDPAALPDLARRTGRPLILLPDPALPSNTWRIESSARA